MTRANFLDAFADPNFFETIDRYEVVEEDFLRPVQALLRHEWEFARRTVWFGCSPPPGRAPELPVQGWKIHVSCAVTNALDILRAVVPILEATNTSFKFALDRRILTMMNGKTWARQGAGKFITIYPTDEADFVALLAALHPATRMFEGIYILSDRRYKDSKVLFYRYGGIKLFAVANERGEEVPMLVSPSGEQVPDERRPVFYLPSWVRDPFEEEQRTAPGEEEEAVDENGQIALKDGRYLVKSVLGFSNSGGVYIALDRTSGEDVVIKEARPFVTFMADSVSLLKKEHRILERLGGSGVAPGAVDLFQDWEHFFLVQELVQGTQLATFSAIHNITLMTHPTFADTEKAYADFRSIFIQLAQILKTLHAQGVVFSDLSPNNIIVLADPLRVRIIDFEGAFEIGVDPPALLFTPGFAYRDQMYGGTPNFASDYFALGAVMHYFLAPVNQIFVIAPRSRFTFLRAVIEDIGFPAAIRELIVGLIENDETRRPTPDQVIAVLEEDHPLRSPHFAADDEAANPRYLGYADRICDYCLALADYSRRDRLFPAFSKVFRTNPLSLSYGACGVAHAMQAMGRVVPERVLDWILQPTSDRDSYAPGLYIGLAGIAWALLDLGRGDAARRILARSHGHPLAYESPDLFHGAAGCGLANLKFFVALADERYLEKAIEAGEHLQRSARESDKGLYWETRGEIPLGLGHGPSGIALFLLYLHLVAGREDFLATGVRALDYDLASGVATRDGGLSWRRQEGGASILYPYCQYGSAGVGAAVVRYHHVLGGERYRGVLDRIALDLDRKYAVFPGLFIGLAGIGETLVDFHRFTGEERFRRAAYRVATGLSLFRIEKNEGLAFPGDMLTKICCDLATGSSGVGRFLYRLVHGGPAPLLLDQLLVAPLVAAAAGSVRGAEMRS